MKVGKDAVGEGRDSLKMKPKRVVPPSNSGKVSSTDKDLDSLKRQSFLTEEEREQRIREFMAKQSSSKDHRKTSG